MHDTYHVSDKMSLLCCLLLQEEYLHVYSTYKYLPVYFTPLIQSCTLSWCLSYKIHLKHLIYSDASL